MNNPTPHQLFVLLTDICALDCEFCFYKEIRKTDTIRVNKGHAKESLTHLINGSAQVGLSGHGEPLNNIGGLIDILKLSSQKRFDLTTSGSFPTKKLLKFIEEIETTCQTSNNECWVRLSLDTFHARAVHHDNFSNLISWFLQDGKWQKCRLYFRSITSEEEFVSDCFTNACRQNNWDFRWESKSQFAKVITINEKPFEVIFRPIVKPVELGLQDKYPIYEYLDMLSDTNGREFKLGFRKGDSLGGLDVTINPDGNIYFYGAELSSLGCIYDEIVDYDLLTHRLDSNPIYTTIRNAPFKQILFALAKEPRFKKCIEETNSPHWVIRTLNDIDSERLKQIILSIK